MSYLVLARKWRPMTFDDLVGQEHVSRTLSNAITSGRIAHAFLFTGVRGVGKTTSARILAKALNCEKGPTPTPCLKCDACREIADGIDLDVQEIDGASYNGVDEVRKLQESLPYRPSRDRYKIVIVDEVHMLSNNAWNAFLKTLEEPPPHVKFIFATTEVHKVPVTILSRVQRYDFKLISNALIAKRLRFVLEQEQIEADDAAIALMAREAAGSMRDAMSMLDQAIAWGGKNLKGEEISRVLGIAGRSVLHDLATAVVEGDASEALALVGRLADQGFDLVQVARDTLEHLRDVVVVKISKNLDGVVELTGEELEKVKQLAAKTSVEDLLRVHLGFSQSFDQVVRAPQQRAALEMLLVRLALRPPLIPVDNLISRLENLERRLGAKGVRPRRRSPAPQQMNQPPPQQVYQQPRQSRATTPQSAAQEPVRQAPRPASEPNTPEQQPSRVSSPQAAVQSTAVVEASGGSTRSSADEAPAEHSPFTKGDGVRGASGDTEAAARQSVSSPQELTRVATAPQEPPEEQRPMSPEEAAALAELDVEGATSLRHEVTSLAPRDHDAQEESSAQDESRRQTRSLQSPSERRAKVEESSGGSAPPSSEPSPSSSRVEEPSVSVSKEQLPEELQEAQRTLWRRIVDVMVQKNATLGAVLAQSVPLEVTEAVVRFGIEAGSFYERQARTDRARVLLEQVIGEVVGQDAKIVMERLHQDAVGQGPRTVYQEMEQEERAEQARKRREVEQHPLVRAIVDELGAEILRIEFAKK